MRTMLKILTLNSKNDKQLRSIVVSFYLLLLVSLQNLVYGFLHKDSHILLDLCFLVFHLIVLVSSAYFHYSSNQGSSTEFSFGLGRLIVISGFINGVASLFKAFHISTTGIQSFHPLISATSKPFLISTRLGVDIFLLFYLRGYAKLGPIFNENKYVNLHGIFLVFFGDFLLVSASILVYFLSKTGIKFIQPFCYLCSGICLGAYSLPLIKRTSLILLQTTPAPIAEKIKSCLSQVLNVEGVVEYNTERFWSINDGVYIGSLRVIIRNESHEEQILNEVKQIFQPIISHLTVEIEKQKIEQQQIYTQLNNYLLNQQNSLYNEKKTD
ncbi:hypothetical protein M0813_15864 [Anaeramoeba flamelloides]|uniref:Cation efflux protein transmembrane domain-containing protein n=1 Tax=Anaeramoeba flamelloides TaxID=1746091 RepID=A0ABQ8Z2C8_9EUKA|nr:hypothetical protein M0813_15864 [Anaeramoeba flamelloides]